MGSASSDDFPKQGVVQRRARRRGSIGLPLVIVREKFMS